MALSVPTTRTSKEDTELTYRFLPEYDLVKKIAENGDRQALNEFHKRTIFTYGNENARTCADFIKRCSDTLFKRASWAHNSFEISDKAYELTIDKFWNIPDESNTTDPSGHQSNNTKHTGTDCRNYFKAGLKRIKKSFEENPPAGDLEQDIRVTKIIQGLVSRQFYFSALEAKRIANPLWSRYYWNIKGGKVCVWLPIYLKGTERREWLENNIKDPDPFRPEEDERIQTIINHKLANPAFIPYKDALKNKSKEPAPDYDPWNGDFNHKLVTVVADEKAENIELQRRSIKKLGKKKLKALIYRIFEDIESGKNKDSQVAKEYGLSKATLSRFAGSRWNNTEGVAPDLWLNTAYVLSKNKFFQEVVEATGKMDQIRTILKQSHKKKTWP